MVAIDDKATPHPTRKKLATAWVFRRAARHPKFAWRVEPSAYARIDSQFLWVRNELRETLRGVARTIEFEMNRRRRSKAEILTDIRAVARMLNHSPSSVEYTRFGRYHIRTVQRKFNMRWAEIVRSAGLRYTARTSRRIVNTQELIRDLLRIRYQIGHAPTKAEYAEHGKFDPQVIVRRSGKTNWVEAAAFLAGLNPEEIRQQQAKGGLYRSTSEWLSRLHNLASRLGRAPTTAEANSAGINAASLCKRVHGNWSDVLQAAHIDIGNRKRGAILRSTSTEVMLRDVVAVSRHLGRPAKMREYAVRGHYSHLSLRTRFGGWRRVKQIVAQNLCGGPILLRIADAETIASELAIRNFFSADSI